MDNTIYDSTIPESEGLRWDLRNKEWTRAYNEAIRFINYNTNIYFNDVWVPLGLKQGDIIRADLMTSYADDGVSRRSPRNTLFMGAFINKETLAIESFALMPLSFQTEHHDPEYELCFSTAHPPFSNWVIGLRRNETVLRSGRIDCIPVKSDHLGFFVDANGLVKDEAFQTFQKSIDAGAEYRPEKPRTPRSVNVDDCYFIPSLNPDLWDREAKFVLPEHKGNVTTYADLSPEDQKALKDRYQEDLLFKLMEARVQRLQEKNHRFAMTKGRLEREREDLYRFRQYIRENRPEIGDDGVSEIISGVIKSITSEQPERLEGEEQRLTQSDIPSVKQLLNEQLHEYVDRHRQRNYGLEAIMGQNIDPDSMENLVNLGIGGLKRDETVQLPKELWRGRVIVMRIADLSNHDLKNKNAYRPCVLHKLYARIDKETGQPVLAGVEAYPMTRTQGNLFMFKMGMRSPFKTKDKRPSWLIADLMIRAPLTEEFFHPKQAENIYYDPKKSEMDVFDIKRGLQEERNDGPDIYGLREIPKDWIEIRLPDTPSERMRSKLDRMSKTAFDHVSGGSNGRLGQTFHRRNRKIKARGKSYG